MGNSGLAASDSTNVDLHMVMIKVRLDSLLKGDTIVIYEGIVSHWNGDSASFVNEVRASKQWYEDHIKPPPPLTCCLIRGDADGLGSINVGDPTFLTDYLFFDGPAPPCQDPDGTYPEGDADGLGSINVGDPTYLTDYLFFDGPAPPPCP